jgi:hypothetical protein
VGGVPSAVVRKRKNVARETGAAGSEERAVLYEIFAHDVSPPKRSRELVETAPKGNGIIRVGRNGFAEWWRVKALMSWVAVFLGSAGGVARRSINRGRPPCRHSVHR